MRGGGVLVRTLALMAGATALAGQTVTTGAAARFLKQASWGPTPDTIARVQQLGFTGYLEEQFAAPPSPLPDVPPNANGRQPTGPVQQQFFWNARNGEDQLRQRVAFALSEIFVVSATKLTTADQLLPYLRMLQHDAFATFPAIVYDVTLSPSMGRYLDMVNNDKPNPATGRRADENYARELLQLFTIGLTHLNDDGTMQLQNGQPAPTYDEAVVEGLARALTGWTFPPKPGAASIFRNPAYFEGQMVPVQANHDTGVKTLLGGATLAAGRTAQEDLDGALQNILGHHNVAPFISRQLIQRLVTGDPRPEYVARVASAFRASGGDMKTVLRAILLDSEARAGDEPAHLARFAQSRGLLPVRTEGRKDADFGHLREPVLFINGLLRALNATVAMDNTLAAQGSAMGQNVYFAPSVFNYFSPGYRLSTSGSGSVNAPEFQILSTTTAMRRADFVNTLVYRSLGGVTLDWSPYLNLAPAELVDALDATLMNGRMPDFMRGSVLRAVRAQTSARARAQAAVYLIASSPQYQMER